MSDFDDWYDDPSTLGEQDMELLSQARGIAEAAWNAGLRQALPLLQRYVRGHQKAYWHEADCELCEAVGAIENKLAASALSREGGEP